MARNPKESNSESESSKHPSSSTTTTTKTSQKVKNQANYQKQQQYLTKHIHSNGPNDKPKVLPLDFDKYSDEVLIKYNKRYGLNLPNPTSVNNDILNSEIGKKTFTKRNSSNGGVGKKSSTPANKITKIDLANQVKNHFLNLPTKENEIITNFLYKVKHQDDEFKLTFK
ncbi:hypothetical protein DFJ63DRAFT_52283 [Scheffersomyces coipomensis]|uniref:uncharacterized protein n=1 Tax=Scheffersomyces coipomensis TaxID=1788519 RepID=UPI00315DEAFD